MRMRTAHNTITCSCDPKFDESAILITMKLLFQCQDSGKVICYNVDPSEVLLQSVEKLGPIVSRELYGLSQPLQLRYVPTGNMVPITSGILMENALFLAIKQFVLTVKTGTDLEILVQSDTTISEVKNAMRMLGNGMLEGEQLLLKDKSLKDNQTLDECGLNPHCSLILQKCAVLVETVFEGTITCYVLYDATVLGLKHQLSTVKGMVFDEQKLYLNEIELENNKAISSYGIVHGSTVYLESEISVTLSTSATIIVRVKGSDTAIHIKEQVFMKTGLEID